MRRKKRLHRGFTLIELVIYMGILTILLVFMSSIFTSILDVQLDSTSTSSVNQDGRYMLSKLLYDVKSASSSGILTPAIPTSQSATMQLTINSVNYTYSASSSGNFQVVNNSTGEANVLNSYDTSISGLNFARIGNGSSSDTIQVSFTVTSRNIERAGVIESKSFETTLGTQ